MRVCNPMDPGGADHLSSCLDDRWIIVSAWARRASAHAGRRRRRSALKIKWVRFAPVLSDSFSRAGNAVL